MPALRISFAYIIFLIFPKIYGWFQILQNYTLSSYRRITRRLGLTAVWYGGWDRTPFDMVAVV
jgi:hypothetical protein